MYLIFRYSLPLLHPLGLRIGREQELPAHIEDMAARCRQDETEVHHLELEIEASMQQLCAGLKECVEVLVFLMQKFKLDQHAVSLRHPFQCNVCKFAVEVDLVKSIQ